MYIYIYIYANEGPWTDKEIEPTCWGALEFRFPSFGTIMRITKAPRKMKCS